MGAWTKAPVQLTASFPESMGIGQLSTNAQKFREVTTAKLREMKKVCQDLLSKRKFYEDTYLNILSQL